MTTIKTLKQAKSYGVVIKGNSKIHGSTFSTDPLQCKVGSKLRDIEGSTCNKCYAIKLSKVYPSALQSWKDNLSKFRHNSDNLTLWCEAIAYQINHISEYKKRRGLKGTGFHRWFSSGDLDSLDMLKAICYVAKLTPTIKHWLPTREIGILRQYLNHLGTIPDNLTIRISDTKIDEQTKRYPLQHKNVTYSGVHTKELKAAIECPAYSNSGECGDCSKCWDSTILKISYKLH